MVPRPEVTVQVLLHRSGGDEHDEPEDLRHEEEPEHEDVVDRPPRAQKHPRAQGPNAERDLPDIADDPEPDHNLGPESPELKAVPPAVKERDHEQHQEHRVRGAAVDEPVQWHLQGFQQVRLGREDVHRAQERCLQGLPGHVYGLAGRRPGRPTRKALVPQGAKHLLAVGVPDELRGNSVLSRFELPSGIGCLADFGYW